jgi:hypothetical protein
MLVQSQEPCHSGAESCSLKINDLHLSFRGLLPKFAPRMRHSGSELPNWHLNQAPDGIRLPNTAMGMAAAAQ